MTVLILAHRKIIPLALSAKMVHIVEGFRVLNRRGFITVLFLISTTFLVVGYLVGLFWTFNAGLSVGQDNATLNRLTEEYSRVALSVERQENTLAEEYGSLLQSMEKVSTMKYLEKDSVVASYAASFH